jgi:PhnB protein
VVDLHQNLGKGLILGDQVREAASVVSMAQEPLRESFPLDPDRLHFGSHHRPHGPREISATPRFGCGRWYLPRPGTEMTSIQPELWVDSPSQAIRFYEAAFGATILHRVGHGEDTVAQLAVGDAAFWVAPASSTMKRLSPHAIDGSTGRTLLVVEDPDSVVRQAVAAGAAESSAGKTSTAGGSGGLSTRLVTSGRSARPTEPGRRLERVLTVVLAPRP